MKNRKKALIALAVGGMLVGTTGTTLALWQDTGSLSAAPINTGRLGLYHSTNNNAHWTWSISRSGQTITPSGNTSKLATPILQGDVITATTYVDARLAGTNLRARLSAPSSLAGGHAETWTDINVASWPTTVTVGQTAELSAARDRIPVTVKISVATPLPRLAAGSDIYQDVNLGNFTLTLEQVR